MLTKSGRCSSSFENSFNICGRFESGAIVNRVCLEKHYIKCYKVVQTNNFICKIGFDTAENEPSKMHYNLHHTLQMQCLDSPFVPYVTAKICCKIYMDHCASKGLKCCFLRKIITFFILRGTLHSKKSSMYVLLPRE